MADTSAMIRGRRTSGSGVAAGVKQYLAREIGEFWRVDLIGLILTTALGLFLRTQLFNSFVGAVTVTLLLEPFTLVVILATRPVLLRLNTPLRLAVSPLAPTALLFAAAAMVATAWAKVVWLVTGWTVPTWNETQSWLVPWAYYCFVMVSWSIARLWVAAERTARAEKERAMLAAAEAMKAELNHLRHQHDPHFLFNALGGIASEITIRPKNAVEMVRDLADYLRYSLDHRDLTVANFTGEIDSVRAYLELQRARFGDNLSFELSADKQARRHRTPAYLLQPLVENAVKHGLKSGRKPLNIAVEATSDGGRLHIVVANSGTLDRDWATGGDPGVGLSVLRRRLALHYPDRHRFDLQQIGDMVTVKLEVHGEPCFA
ncbi:MAG: histidine kinase [Proteobacteria bacterium]|nr:histidine kinase [Pseudomonadota bacterium]